MKHLILVIAAFITLASCEKRAKQSSAPKQESTTMVKAPVKMTQEELGKIVGDKVASKIFSTLPESAKGKHNAVLVFLNDLVLTGSNAGAVNNVTTTLPANPNFAGIQFTQTLAPGGLPDFSYPAGETTIWWEAGIVGSPYITTFSHPVNSGSTWYYFSWANDLSYQVHISTTIQITAP